MRYLLCIAWGVMFLTARVAVADEPRPSDASPGDKVEMKSPADGTQTTATGETWRYKKYQGLWWYWLPSNKWVYWTGDRWVPYETTSFSEFSAKRGQYQGNSDPSWGQWGPVRYNQYGQRQYPYSARSSGLQQLGPVPAMGGVRSLPGWTGER